MSRKEGIMGKALGLRRYGFSSQLYHSFPVCLLGLKKKKKHWNEWLQQGLYHIAWSVCALALSCCLLILYPFSYSLHVLPAYSYKHPKEKTAAMLVRNSSYTHRAGSNSSFALFTANIYFFGRELPASALRYKQELLTLWPLVCCQTPFLCLLYWIK